MQTTSKQTHPKQTLGHTNKNKTITTQQTNVKIDALLAAGEYRPQVKNLTKSIENVDILEFHDHIICELIGFCRVNINVHLYTLHIYYQDSAQARGTVFIIPTILFPPNRPTAPGLGRPWRLDRFSRLHPCLVTPIYTGVSG